MIFVWVLLLSGLLWWAQNLITASYIEERQDISIKQGLLSFLLTLASVSLLVFVII